MYRISILSILLPVILIVPTNISAQASYWDVISIAESSDTLIVGLEIHGMYICPYDCFDNKFSRLEVSPCPLDTECSGDKYTLIRTTDINDLVYLKLLKGYQYTFSGLWNDIGYVSGTGCSCCRVIACGEILYPKVFPDEYVATSTSSWGAIKSLYK